MFLKKFLNSKSQIQINLINLKKSSYDLINTTNYKYITKNNTFIKFPYFSSRKFSQTQEKIISENKTSSEFQNLTKKNIDNSKDQPNLQEKFFRNLFQNYESDNTYHEIDDNKFDLFLDKMSILIKKENLRKEKIEEYSQEIKAITLQSKEPLNDLLIHYQVFRNENGFDAEAISETILTLGKTFSSRTRFHQCFSDKTHWEFINSYRFFNLVEDIKFSIVNQLSYLNGDQLMRVIKGLKLCNYKNTELALLIQERLSSIIFNKNISFSQKYKRFADMPGVGKKDFFHKNLYAEDLTKDENFLIYVKKLMKMDFIDETQNEEKNILSKYKDVKEEEKEQILSLENNIKNIVDLMQTSKDLQYNFTDNLNNLIDQYYQMEQLMIDNPIIRENPYLKYSLQKIQDKFLEMGFIDLDTFKLITTKKLDPEEFKKLKTENVMNILRDYVYVNFPEIFSTVIDDIESSQVKNNDEFKLNLTKFRMTPDNFTACLRELSEYSKITNIDINSEDYANKNFNLDYYNKDIPDTPVEYIKTKPQFTKLYSETFDFFKSIKKEIFKKFKIVEDFKFHANFIYSYANMNVITKDIVEYSLKECTHIISNEKIYLQNEDIVTFVYGLGLSGHDVSINIIKLVMKKFDFSNINLNFENTTKLIWSLLSLEYDLNEKLFELVRHLNTFDVMNHITEQIEYYNNDSLFYELSVGLKEYAKKYHIENKEIEKVLFLSNKYFDNKSTILQKNELNLKDPLKENMKEFFIQKFYKDEAILNIKEKTIEFEKVKMPFNPDFVLDIYGNKICLFLNSLDKDFSVSNFNGSQRLIKNILEKFYNCVCVFIPITKLISLDMNTLNVKVNSTSNLDNIEKLILNKIISKKPKLSESIKNLNRLNTNFDKFISLIVNNKSQEFDLILNTENKENLEIFFKNLLLATDLIHKIEINCSFSEFNLNQLELKKIFSVLLIISETLSDNFKSLISKNLKFENSTFNNLKDFLISIDNEFEKYHVILNEINHKPDSIILNNDNWIGKRLNVDLINSEEYSGNNFENLLKKNVAVELLNNNYMWFTQYNPYADWEEELKANFDNFNYYSQESNDKFYFNSTEIGNRKLPKGVFPHPTRYRVMKQDFMIKKKIENDDFNNGNSYENEINKFYHLNEILITEEIKKNNLIKKDNIPNNLSMKINLLNINNSLKQNFTDNEILRFISEFEFTDKLIDEYLNTNKDDKNTNIEYVSRNTEDFKNFNVKLDNLKEKFDEYDRYIMKEYYNSENLISYDKNSSPEEIKKELESKMQKKIEENYDDDALSIYNPNEIKYEFNIDSILKNYSTQVKESLLSFSGLGAFANNLNLNNSEKYLDLKRRVSERNFILIKIIVKSIQNKPLSEKENKYLEKLTQNISSANILNIDLVTVNENSSNLQFKDLSSNDIYAMNTLGNVDIKEDLYNFALSDLVLELNNFIDNNTINKIIYEIFSNKKSKDFNFDNQKNSLFDVSNKEPILLNQEIKETIWRISGFFDELDSEKLKNFLRVKRGKSTFDKFWLGIDEASLEEFLRQVNLHENRIEYLEKWIKRKESEYENRFQLPPSNLKLDDSKINRIINKKEKFYRKKILLNIFKTDDLKIISSKEINRFINEFIEFLPLFNFDYPQTIKDIFNVLEDLNEYNIYKEDLEMLKSYRVFFKIYEENPNEFLAVQPIKLDQERLYNILTEENLFDKEKLIDRVKKSTIPFVKNISNNLMNSNK